MIFNSFPRDVLAEEISVIEKMGVEIKTGITFGEDITVESLKKDGFSAVFLATGLHLSRMLDVEGENLPGVLKGVDFLRDTARVYIFYYESDNVVIFSEEDQGLANDDDDDD